MSDVFISYSRKDIAFAKLLFETLQQEEMDAWIDWQRIPIGEDWWKEICSAIEAANVFMFIISRHSVDSPVCKREINHALNNNKRVIPIVLDNLSSEVVAQFVPDLTKINWIAFQRGKFFALEEIGEDGQPRPEDEQVAQAKDPLFSEALEKLGQAIRTDWDWVKYHTRLQVKALTWETRPEAGFLLHGEELEEAEDWLARAAGKDPRPTVLQAQYITTSRQEETKRQRERQLLERKAQQRQRFALWAVGIGLGVAVVLGVLAWSQRNQYLDETYVRATAQAVAVAEANQRATAEAVAVGEANARATQQAIAEQQRDLALARQLAVQSGEVREEKLDLAALLAVRSFLTSDTREGRSALAEALQQNPGLLRYYDSGNPDYWLRDLAVSPDGRWIASGESNYGCDPCPILLWDASSGKLLPDPFVENSMAGQMIFTPDSRSLLARNLDGEVHQWDLLTGVVETLMTDVDGPIKLSPNGEKLAVGGWGEIQIWDFPELSRRDASLTCPDPNSIPGFVFSPDSSVLAYVCGERNQVYFASAQTGELLGATSAKGNGEGIHFFDGIKTFAFAPDGTPVMAVAAHACKTSARKECGHFIWFVDTNTYEWIEDFDTLFHSSGEANTSPGIYLNFTPDARYLVSAELGIKVWKLDYEITLGYEVQSPSSSDLIFDAALMPDGKTLVTADASGALKSWGLDWEPPMREIVSHADFEHYYWMDGGVFLPSAEKYQLIIDEPLELDETSNPGRTKIALYDLDMKPVGREVFEGDAYGVIEKVISPDGRWLALRQRNGEVSLWDIPGRTRAATLIEAGDAIGLASALAFSPDGTALLVGSDEGKIVRLDLTQDPAAASLLAENYPGIIYVRSLAYSSNQKWIIATVMYQPPGEAGGSTDVILLLDPANGEVLESVYPPDGTYWCKVEFHPTEEMMATACSEKISFYRLPGMELIPPTIKYSNATIDLFEFSPDGNLIATLENGRMNDSALQVWDYRTRQLLLTLDNDTHGKISFSADSKLLYSGGGLASRESGLTLWHLDPQEWANWACAIANRDLSSEEWALYLQDIPFQSTCP